MDQQTACPECSARLSPGTSCQVLFESLLALEFSDPAFGEVHLLTVSCFMIQHGRYSDEALAWIRGLLCAYLDEGLPPAELRRLAAQGMGQDVRAWKVVRQPGARPLPPIAWRVTISDVAARATDSESYCAAVKDWARATLEQMAGQIA